ncbi:hypothetical protein DFAR_1450019 [Desulfarculales bacterium]
MPPLPLGDDFQAGLLLRGAAYACDIRAGEAVPAALGAFLASHSAHQTVVLAVSLGGDTDTIAGP